MKRKSYGGLVVILFVCILAFGFGAVFGMVHVGEDLSKEILPTSLTRSSDILQVINEKSFEPANITVKYQTQTKVTPVKQNYTNRTNTDNYTKNYTKGKTKNTTSSKHNSNSRKNSSNYQ